MAVRSLSKLFIYFIINVSIDNGKLFITLRNYQKCSYAKKITKVASTKIKLKLFKRSDKCVIFDAGLLINRCNYSLKLK